MTQQPNKSAAGLTAELAQALGLPRNTTRAVLTLEAGEAPLLEVSMFAIDRKGQPLVEVVPGEYGEGVARRLARVEFMLRLEAFPTQS